MTIKINVNQICEVRILGRRQHPFYEYRQARKSWIHGDRKAGFYDTFTIHEPELVTVDEIEKSGELVCIENTVYYRPRIYIKMSNGDERYIYFNTKEDAMKHFESFQEFSGIKLADIPTQQ